MNNGVIFGLGFATGALAGGVSAYLLAKRSIEKSADEEIDRYKKYMQNKMDHLKSEIGKLTEDDEDEDQEEEKPKSGKYKFVDQVATTITDTYNTVFQKGEKKGKKEMDKYPTDNLDKEIAENNPGIEEISEEEFGTGDYDTEQLDYIFEDDDLFYMYGTDNEMMAEAAYNVNNKNAIISEYWRWAPDYVKNEEEGVGSFFVRNHNLKKDFEVVVHMEPSVEDEE